MDLDTKVEELSGVGLKIAKRLARIEIKTVSDLLYHFPRHYLDFSQVVPIANLNLDDFATIRGQIWQIKNRRTRRGTFLTEAKITDSSGMISVTWFGRFYLPQILKVGEEVYLSGKVEGFGNKRTFTNPQFEIGDKKIHTGRLVPIYPETEGITSKWLRGKVAYTLEELKGKIPENIPEEVLKRQGIGRREESFSKIHFPKNLGETKSARERFAFEELFFIQLKTLERRKIWQEKKRAVTLNLPLRVRKKFESGLPFKLTNAQKKVIEEVLKNLRGSTPSLRLISGDVGSGKTVVAAFAALAAASSGKKTILAAPTEILAFQHHKTLSQLFKDSKTKVSLFTASKKGRGADVIVGTHALIHAKTSFENVGLVIVDEQHRFGVAQRTKLAKIHVKEDIYPHFLTLSATPIPRSLAFILWGDLDLSVIDELPSGRTIPKTYIVPKEKRGGAYGFLREKMKEGRQAFIICPFVSESENFETVKAATSEFERLKKEVFPDLKLGLVHGRLKSKEKENVLDKFSKGKLNILVATPVVEVGIDIPNATVMIIEGAERFGLAQLHQLRGRIARSTHEAFCFLFSDSETESVKKRLSALTKISVGFRLAEVDLKLRGPGDVFGTRQHGHFKLKTADLTDLDLIEKARKEAGSVLASNVHIALPRD